MKSPKCLVLFCLCFSALMLKGQVSIRDSVISFGMVNFTWTPSWPGGTLDERFGFAHMFGGEIGYKFSNQFYVYSGAKMIYGTQVREHIAPDILKFDGTGYGAVGADGRTYSVRLFEWGYAIPLIGGRIFNVFRNGNPNSGFYVEAGPQFMQHKIRMEVVGNNVPALDPEYRKGYDRLSNGFGIVEGFGFKYISRKAFFNFMAGIELSQNFTKNRRSINYDTGEYDDQLRTDTMFGFKVGWMFLIYKRAPEKRYYY